MTILFAVWSRSGFLLVVVEETILLNGQNLREVFLQKVSNLFVVEQ